MKVHSAPLAMALAAGLLTIACSSTTGPGQPGAGGSSSGGTTGTGGTGPVCQDGAACGGSVVGTWSVASSCLSVNGSVSPAWLGLDPRNCTGVTISGSLSVSGTFTANADGTYVDGTTTTGTPRLDLVAGCLILSGTMIDCSGIERVIPGSTCTSTSSGGCTCNLAVNQMGGMGVISSGPSLHDSYRTANNTLTLATDAGDENYSYCVSGSQMTLTPKDANLPVHGTIVLTGGGGPGTGGTSGSGGSTGPGTGGNGTGGSSSGSAGTVGSGGAVGTGGRGGTTGSGGAVGTGGRGGTTGSGGSTGGSAGGRGGTTGSGGSGTGGTTGSGGSGTGGTSVHGEGPCDIYAAASTPCGAAYSTVRALAKAWTGPLYQVRGMSSSMNTGSGGTTKDIPQTSDGFADTSVQDSFCSGTTCTFSILYDQSGNGNDLKSAPAGLSNGGTYAAMPDFESSATGHSLMISGHKVYILYMNAREGYRTPLNVVAKNVPMGNNPQGIYELADGTHAGSMCCWDFGSVSPDPTKYVTMNTLFLGTGYWDKGAGSGPWFMGDFEGGVWAGGSSSSTGNTNNSNPSMKVQFAMGVLHTPVGKYALRMADIKTATDLTTAYDGNIPSGKTWGNAGGIVLGVGGDNSNNSWGTFYEGALTKGSPANATDLAVMQNIQAAGYGK